MYNKQHEIPIDIVHYYLNNGSSLRRTAQKYNIHYQTLFKWVKLYKNHGNERLLSNYKRPWNRAEKELEEKIVLLKEKDPTLTVRKAKENLEKEGIKISIKGIWGIWKRSGYAGFDRKKMDGNFTKYCLWTKEARIKYDEAKGVFELGKIKKSASILNSFPFLPQNELIHKIPDNLLNLRRRIEKIPDLFEKIPLPSYLKKIRNLYNELKGQKLNYSAIRVGIIEIVALAWSGKLEKLLSRTEELKKIMKKKGNYFSYLLFESRFLLLIGESIAYTYLLEIKKAFGIAKTCEKLLKRKRDVSPHFMLNLGVLYMNLEDYKVAETWISKALDRLDEGARKRAVGALAHISLFKGDYKKAINILKHAEFGGRVLDSKKLIFRSFFSLMKGRPQKAISLATKSLSLLKKEEVNIGISGTSFIIASAYCCLGEKLKVEKELRRIRSFLKKNKFKRGLSILKILLSPIPNAKSRIPLDKDILSTVNLALFVRNGDYWRALTYAKKKGILTYFYRYIFFFPDVVINLLEKGKSTGLPKALLKLPVFNKEIPVYHIKLLGDLIVYKNQNYLRVKLQPKDTSFLIHLALRAGEPYEEIPLESLYRNFWKKSKNPSRNLSHLLVRIKEGVNIPSHLLEISYRKDHPVLINKGIHFTTDYDEFQQVLVQTRALLRAGEWGFASKEYLRVFKLFRGEPFRKMYDDWSDDKRLEILFSYENEILIFAKELIAKGKKVVAEKLIKKAKKIIPCSEELEDLLIA